MSQTEPGSSKYANRFADSDYLDAIREHGGAASTREIAETVGCHRVTAFERLQELAEADEIGTRMLGGNTRIWTAD